MLRMPNFGRRSLNEVEEVLAQMGLHFGMYAPEYWDSHRSAAVTMEAAAEEEAKRKVAKEEAKRKGARAEATLANAQRKNKALWRTELSVRDGNRVRLAERVALVAAYQREASEHQREAAQNAAQIINSIRQQGEIENESLAVVLEALADGRKPESVLDGIGLAFEALFPANMSS
jgi:hypothetical protein